MSEIVDEWVMQTLLRAFANDPHILWLLGQPGAPGAESAYRRLFELLLSTPGQRLDAANRQGLAWFLPPGRNMSWRIQMQLFALMSSVQGAGAVTKGLRLLYLESCRPRRPHYWLQLLAVRPEAQGMGLGTALLRLIQHQAAASGHPIYLETGRSQNCAFYQSRGFEVLRRHDMGQGLHLWSLLWQPASQP